ncbi:MAG TPA: tetratricopeptide repeat protein [Vicinamibacterales bacterium]|nr:tetratricopeptide repeat protein [Vicinamibacterales bacterium]
MRKLILLVGLLATPDPTTRALIDSGHYKQARAILEPRVKANPNDAESAALLARVRLEFGDFDGAVQLAETATKLDASNAGYHAILAEAVGRSAQHASMFKQIGMARRYRAEEETALTLDAKNVDAREGLLEYYLNAPSIAGGDRKKADQMAEDIARIDAAAGYLAKATILVETKTTGDLESLYKQAIAAATTPLTKYRATVQLMNVHLAPKTQNLSAAEQDARALIALDPKRVAGYTGLAIVHAYGNHGAAIDAALGEAEKAVPDNCSPHYQAGRVLLQSNGDLARAEKYFRKFLTIEPEAGPNTWAHAHWRLGLVLEKQGRKREAVGELEEAVHLRPDLEDAKKDLKRLRTS